MTHLRQVATVAGWEFRRYFKWKDQIVSFGFFLLMALASTGATMVAGSKGRTVTVALAGVAIEDPDDGRIRFVPAAADDEARTQALRGGEVQGILSRRADGTFELLVTKDPRYRAELVTLVGETVRRERLAASGLTPADLERILVPASLELRFTDPARGRRGRAEKVTAGAFIGILLLAIFTGMAFLFTGITGEKQLRVTESVISAISPQAWIDGKVAGITAYALASVGNIVAGGLVIVTGIALVTDFALPAAAVRPVVLLSLVVYTILGLLLWNAFFAALAATINDPNHSSRSSLLMLPTLPVVLALAVLRDPDSLLSRGLALFPLTSAPALPMRLILSDPGPLEVGVSLALLVGSILLVRRIAGRIFEIGILLQGKEPTIAELARSYSARS